MVSRKTDTLTFIERKAPARASLSPTLSPPSMRAKCWSASALSSARTCNGLTMTSTFSRHTPIAFGVNFHTPDDQHLIVLGLVVFGADLGRTLHPYAVHFDLFVDRNRLIRHIPPIRSFPDWSRILLHEIVRS